MTEVSPTGWILAELANFARSREEILAEVKKLLRCAWSEQERPIPRTFCRDPFTLPPLPAFRHLEDRSRQELLDLEQTILRHCHLLSAANRLALIRYRWQAPVGLVLKTVVYQICRFGGRLDDELCTVVGGFIYLRRRRYDVRRLVAERPALAEQILDRIAPDRRRQLNLLRALMFEAGPSALRAWPDLETGTVWVGPDFWLGVSRTGEILHPRAIGLDSIKKIRQERELNWRLPQCKKSSLP